REHSRPEHGCDQLRSGKMRCRITEGPRQHVPPEEGRQGKQQRDPELVAKHRDAVASMRLVAAMLWPRSRLPITGVHLVVAVLVVSHLVMLRFSIVGPVRCGLHRGRASIPADARAREVLHFNDRWEAIASRV